MTSLPPTTSSSSTNPTNTNSTSNNAGNGVLNNESQIIITPDWLRSSPPSLTIALVRIGPVVKVVRSALEAGSWKGSWYLSTVLVFSWWALCLGARPSLVGFLLLAWLWLSPSPIPAKATPVIPPQSPMQTTSSWPAPSSIPSEASLQRTIQDLLRVSSLLPSPTAVLSSFPRLTIRASIILYAFILAVAYIVPGRVITGVLGTIVLCLRAPWLNYVCATVWRSAWVRWGVYKLWARVSGVQLSTYNSSITTSASTVNAATIDQEEDRFLFTLYENQRWWMGLDWTAALLPAERPSWCSSPPHLTPVQPPAAFTLPVGWKWAEPEWSVIVHSSQDEAGKREVKETPSEEEGLLAKAAGRVRGDRPEHERMNSMDVKRSPSVDTRPNAGKDGEEADEEEVDDPLTDAEGWVYGDNKWEAQGPKGGIGKYTRFRRWTRIAVVAPADAAQTEPGPVSPNAVQATAMEAPDSASTESSPSRLTNRFKGVIGRG